MLPLGHSALGPASPGGAFGRSPAWGRWPFCSVPGLSRFPAMLLQRNRVAGEVRVTSNYPYFVPRMAQLYCKSLIFAQARLGPFLCFAALQHG